MGAYYASRALQALELLTFQDLSCPQLAAALQTHPRTARRLLARLVADGYAEQTFDSRRRYRATLRLAALGCQIIAHAELPRVAAPFVAELHVQTGATTHLVIPSYRSVACVVHCDRHQTEPPRPMLRELLPAHATAAGKVLLAYRQPWRDSILAEPLARFTERTATSSGEIESTAAHTRLSGYALEDGEYQTGTLAVAAPVFDHDQVPAALVISTAHQTCGSLSVDALAELVTAAAVGITNALTPTRRARSVRHAHSPD